MAYQNATWRVLIAKGMYVEVSVKGLDHDRQSCEAGDILRAGSVLKDVGRAMRSIAARWEFTRYDRSAQPQKAVAVDPSVSANGATDPGTLTTREEESR